MQFAYLHFEHPHILRTSDELSGSIFFPVYHPQDMRDEKVSSALAHWEHGKCDGIRTDFRRIFRQSFVRMTFNRDSVLIPLIPRILKFLRIHEGGRGGGGAKF